MTASAAQPLPFSHKRHAGLKIECLYCHAKAATGDRAGFPPAAKCMVCHREVAKNAPAIERLAGLAGDIAIVPEQPLYVLPDFVIFTHQRHRTKSISCASCHGDVWMADALKPQLQMKMKACVDCHKSNQARTTCILCHELNQ